MTKSIFIGTLGAILVSGIFLFHPAHAADQSHTYHMNRSIPGCKSRAVFDKIATIADEGDNATAARLLAAGIYTGECAMLTKGEVVYVEDLTPDYRLAKVRPKGDVFSYWTGLKFVAW